MIPAIAELPSLAAIHELRGYAASLLLTESAEVAPMPSSLNASETAVATELLSTTDAADFADALDATLLTVDDWAWNSRARRIPAFDASLVLGAVTARVGPAYAMMVDGQPATVASKPIRGSWTKMLYRADIPPQIRISLCQMLCGYAAHLALLRAFEMNTALPAHVAEGLVAALERSGEATQALLRL